MLNLVYYLKINKQNLKFVKFNFLILHLILTKLISTAVNKQICKKKKIKTLMLSPFHYKVAKKNIIQTYYNFSLCIKFKIKKQTYLNLIIFFFWKYQQILKNIPSCYKINFIFKKFFNKNVKP